MKGYLIYATRYGSTKQVCQWISEGIPFSVSTRQVSDFPVDTVDFLILGTPVFIGKMCIRDSLYISTVRAIYLYQRGQGRLERLLDSSLWKNLRGTKLGHIGALAALPDGALVFSDTLRNELYYLRISKSDG